MLIHNRKEHTKCEFAVHEVYAVDVLVSTGDGKTKEKDNRTTVYKRTTESYNLKMKASRSKTIMLLYNKYIIKDPWSLKSMHCVKYWISWTMILHNQTFWYRLQYEWVSTLLLNPLSCCCNCFLLIWMTVNELWHSYQNKQHKACQLGSIGI